MSEHERIEFGDDEPEDAWDATDPVDVLIENMRRRVERLEGCNNLGEVLVALETRVRGQQMNQELSEHHNTKARLLLEDINFVRTRIKNGD